MGCSLNNRSRDARTAIFDAWGGLGRATYCPRYDVKRPCLGDPLCFFLDSVLYTFPFLSFSRGIHIGG